MADAIYQRASRILFVQQVVGVLFMAIWMTLHAADGPDKPTLMAAGTALYVGGYLGERFLRRAARALGLATEAGKEVRHRENESR